MENMTVAPAMEQSKLARTALIIAVATLFVLPIGGNIVAIAIGILARRQIRASHGQLGGDNKALLAIVIGCVGLCVWSSLMFSAMLLAGGAK